MVDKLIEKIIAMQNPTCVGLDTDFGYLPDEIKNDVTDFEGVAKQITEFNKNIIDAVCDIVPSVKVQIAYYEMYGEYGVKAFNDTVNYAKNKGLIVIADCKRNDIGSTASCYAKAYLGETEVGGKNLNAFKADMLTVNGYLGSDGIEPFVKEIKQHDKSIFVLVKTSNPSSGEFQNLKLGSGEYVYEHMGKLVEKWGADTVGKYGYSEVGAVVGATHPEEAEHLRNLLKTTFFLIPGYGAQGGKGADLVPFFNKDGLGAIVNSSRGIIAAYKQEKYAAFGETGYADASRAAVLDMKEDIASALAARV